MTTAPQGSGSTGYLRGLHASVRNNASAYGFSVTITASFGLLTAVLGAPTVSLGRLGSFAATSVYLLLFGVELPLIAYLRRKRSSPGLSG